MTLSEFMDARELTDESLAALIREDGTPCDRSTVNRLRNGKIWLSKRIAVRLKSISDGAVSLDTFVNAEVGA